MAFNLIFQESGADKAKTKFPSKKVLQKKIRETTIWDENSTAINF